MNTSHEIKITPIHVNFWNKAFPNQMFEIECTTQWSSTLEADMKSNGLLICFEKSSFDTDIVTYLVRFPEGLNI